MAKASAVISINLSCLESTLLPLVKLGVHQDPQGLFCKAAFQMGGPQCELVTRFALSKGQRFVLPLVELPDAPVSPFLWPAEVPLGDNTISGSSATPLRCVS